MAHIAFYDATADDKAFFLKILSDHTLSFVPEPINEQNMSSDAEIVSIFVSSKVTKELLCRSPNLKLLATRSTGFDHIDMTTAQERHIPVVTVPTYGEHTVAEYTFGLLLALTRKLPAALVAAHNGNRSHTELTGVDLCDKTFGIIGAGKIGRNTAKLAKAFSMKILAYDPFPNEQAATEIGYEYCSLEDLLKQSDVVSLHVPYTPDNHHLLNAERLGSMKPSSILINTARGELVDTKALVDCVGKGHLGGVALDVIESEQLISPLEELALLRAEQVDSTLLQHSMEINILQDMPNVLITSHNAFNTKEAIERINQTTADNIRAFLSGTPQNLAKV